MNSFDQRVFYKGEEVWRAQLLPWGEVLNRTDKAYRIFTMSVR